MSLRSTTGSWAVRTGGRLVGPFDGKSPARQFRSELLRNGIAAELERPWSPADARRALRSIIPTESLAP